MYAFLFLIWGYSHLNPQDGKITYKLIQCRAVGRECPSTATSPCGKEAIPGASPGCLPCCGQRPWMARFWVCSLQKNLAGYTLRPHLGEVYSRKIVQHLRSLQVGQLSFPTVWTQAFSYWWAVPILLFFSYTWVSLVWVRTELRALHRAGRLQVETTGSPSSLCTRHPAVFCDEVVRTGESGQ